MNDTKRTITLLACCCIILTTAPSSSADFVGVTTVNKIDADTMFLCNEGNGDFVWGPLTVCNVFAVFDVGADRLLNIGNADLQVWSGADPGVFYQHPFGHPAVSPACNLLPVFPDLLCDSFVTIGVKCSDFNDGTSTDPDFDSAEFNNNGHLVGGWFNANPLNGQGDAGQDPPNQNLQVLFLQSSVAQGNSMSGNVDVFWGDPKSGDAIAELDVPIECAGCSKDNMCDDGNACTEDACDPASGCTFAPINCDDGDPCTDDFCDPDTGCTHEDIECPKGQVCDPATGECVEIQDPCECVNGRVTLCHIPPGNFDNARTIIVGCAARDRHLAHGDFCGPCEDGDG